MVPRGTARIRCYQRYRFLALIFVGIVEIDSVDARGWAIPAASDNAFALSVLALVDNRFPP